MACQIQFWLFTMVKDLFKSSLFGSEELILHFKRCSQLSLILVLIGGGSTNIININIKYQARPTSIFSVHTMHCFAMGFVVFANLCRRSEKEDADCGEYNSPALLQRCENQTADTFWSGVVGPPIRSERTGSDRIDPRSPLNTARQMTPDGAEIL